MAKSNKDRDRRAIVEEMRKQQQARERRGSLLWIGASVAVGLAIIGAAAVPFFQNRQAEARNLDEIGVAASAAGCQEVVTEPASGNNNHVPAGQKVLYEQAPPAFGPHYDTAERMTRKFFTAEDRPQVETLVHNLEHGFTILWYDEDAAADEDTMREIESITEEFPATVGIEDKFMAAPWTSEDGEPFPGDANIALTHWSVGEGGEDSQVGVWQYCAEPSGEVVAQFVEDYPFTDAPEGNVPG